MKLTEATLSKLGNIAQPQYPRETTRPGIVHLGVGAFHRAHQAWYTEAAMNRFGGNWRIIGVSLRRPAMRDALQPQDNLYSLVTRRDDTAECQVIGALCNTLVAPENPNAVIEALANPDIHVVTLTITEKGYGLDAASGTLDTTQSEIASDLNNTNAPQSALGFLAEALALRQQEKRSGLTLISCDNLSDNGHKLRAALLQFVQLKNPALTPWIEQHCRFPNTMVDRIVPATSEHDIAEFGREFGFRDAAPVFTEPFSQWVIEKNFAGPVPPWDKVGAQFVDDVAPFEAAKLRTLNASHSLIAYLGCVHGKETVADAMQETTIREAVIELMREAEATFKLPDSFSVRDYQQELIARFDNRALKHRCAQIAMDGSQKIPQRIVPIIEWHIAHGRSPRHACKAIAAWLAFLRSGLPVQDPMASTLETVKTGSMEQGLDTLLGLRAIFPVRIAENPKLRTLILDSSPA